MTNRFIPWFSRAMLELHSLSPCDCVVAGLSIIFCKLIFICLYLLDWSHCGCVSVLLVYWGQLRNEHQACCQRWHSWHSKSMPKAGYQLCVQFKETVRFLDGFNCQSSIWICFQQNALEANRQRLIQLTVVAVAFIAGSLNSGDDYTFIPHHWHIEL